MGGREGGGGKRKIVRYRTMGAGHGIMPVL